ncbi:MAG TPA: hypothetical protein VJV97_08245 [Gemmatimonadaceae bacterium]|nr:hypothetical protein [Gemmatimonadaceae bacterium]
MRKVFGDGDRDISLTHAHIVAEQSPAELIDSDLESRDSGELMWVKRDRSKRGVGIRRTKNHPGDPRADRGGRRNAPIAIAF